MSFETEKENRAYFKGFYLGCGASKEMGFDGDADEVEAFTQGVEDGLQLWTDAFNAGKLDGILHFAQIDGKDKIK